MGTPGQPDSGSDQQPPSWLKWLVDLTLMVGAVMLGWWLMGLLIRRYSLLGPEKFDKKPADADKQD